MEFLLEASGSVDPIDISLAQLLSALSKEVEDEDVLLVKDFSSFLQSQEKQQKLREKCSKILPLLRVYLNHFGLDFLGSQSSHGPSSPPSSEVNSKNLALFLKYTQKISWESIVRTRRLQSLLLLFLLNFQSLEGRRSLLPLLLKLFFSLSLSLALSPSSSSSSYSFTNKFHLQELYKIYLSKLKSLSSVFHLLEFILSSVLEYNVQTKSPLDLSLFFQMLLAYTQGLPQQSERLVADRLFLLQELLVLQLTSLKGFSSYYAANLMEILCQMYHSVSLVSRRLNQNLFLSTLFIPDDKSFTEKLFQSASNLISFSPRSQQEAIKFWNQQVMESNAVVFSCNGGSVKTFEETIQSPTVLLLFGKMKAFNIHLYECSNSLPEAFLLWFSTNLKNSFLFSVFVEENFSILQTELSYQTKFLCQDFRKRSKNAFKSLEKEVKKLSQTNPKVLEEDLGLGLWTLQINLFSPHLKEPSLATVYAKDPSLQKYFEDLFNELQTEYKSKMIAYQNLLSIYFLIISVKLVDRALIDVIFNNIANIVEALNYEMEQTGEKKAYKLLNLLLFSTFYLDLLVFLISFSSSHILLDTIVSYAINKFIQFLHIFFTSFDVWLIRLDPTYYSLLHEFKRKLVQSFFHIFIHRFYIYEPFLHTSLSSEKNHQTEVELDEFGHEFQPSQGNLKEDCRHVKHFFHVYYFYFLHDLSFLHLVYLFVFIFPYFSIKLDYDNISYLEYIHNWYLEEKNNLSNPKSFKSLNVCFFNKSIFFNLFNLSLKSINIIRYNLSNNDTKQTNFLFFLQKFFIYWPSSLSTTIQPSFYSLTPYTILSLYEKFLYPEINECILTHYQALEFENNLKNPYQDHFSRLNEDLYHHILTFLPYKAVLKFKLLSKKYYLTYASLSNNLWKFYFFKNFTSCFFLDDPQNIDKTCEFISSIQKKTNSQNQLYLKDSEQFLPLITKITQFNQADPAYQSQIQSQSSSIDIFPSKNFCSNCYCQYLLDVNTLLGEDRPIEEIFSSLNLSSLQLNQRIQKNILTDTRYSKKLSEQCSNKPNLQHNWQELFFYQYHFKLYYNKKVKKKKACPVIGCRKKISLHSRGQDGLIDHFVHHYSL